jgi:hypothetical protein
VTQDASLNGNVYVKGNVSLGGNFGIGTTNPVYPLHITQTGGATSGSGGFQTTAAAGSVGTWGLAAIQIYLTGSIRIGDAVAYASDERIKKNIIHIDDNDGLSQLRKISPRIYQYIDNLTHRREPVYGFIAQEVESVIPYAVKQLTDKIPNIYEMAVVSNKNFITLTNKSTSDFVKDSSGNLCKNIKFYDASNKEILTTIVSVIDDKTFQIADDLNMDTIFVYGQEVPDYRTLDKDAIFTITTAAVQQIDREFQEAKQTIQTLEARLAAMDARLSAAGF